jgi:hypothetical protein
VRFVQIVYKQGLDIVLWKRLQKGAKMAEDKVSIRIEVERSLADQLTRIAEAEDLPRMRLIRRELRRYALSHLSSVPESEAATQKKGAEQTA